MIQLRRSLALCFVIASFCSIGFAQDEGEPGLVFRSLARGSQTRVTESGTIALRAMLMNTSDHVQQGTLVATVDGVSGLQSARRVVVEPNDTSFIDIYVQLPDAFDGPSTEITATLYINSGGREVVQDRNGVPATHTLTLGVNRLPTLAALFMDPQPPEPPFWWWPEAPPFTSYELAMATRIDAGNSRITASFDDTPLPLNYSDWEIIDVAMIAEPRAFDDASFVESLKRFVMGGGRAWVMLDRVPTEKIRSLLGAGQACETVDEIELNDFVVEIIGGQTPLAEQDRTVVSETPLKMKRVIQSGGRVSHRINGWPAAIWMPLGYGEVLLTTLDAGAWSQHRKEPSLDIRFQTEYESRLWAKQLAADINTPRAEKPLSRIVDYPTRQIGNPVVPRSWVATALLGFCILLIAIGGWRIWAGELASMGIVAPVCALLVSGILLVSSGYVRREIPESVSRLQLIQVSGDGSVAMVREQSAVYLESSSAMDLDCPVDGLPTVDSKVDSGVRRFELVDFHQWQLKNESWPTGTWRYQSSYNLPTRDLVVNATLDEQGIRMEMPELVSPLEDPVLGFTVGDPMLCTADGDGYRSTGDLQAANRWISGALISSEQRRRLDVYEAYFDPGERTEQLRRVLFGWTKPWPGGPEWSAELEEKGGALVALPVRLKRPAPDSQVYVPHGLAQLRVDPTQSGQTFAFNDRTGKWEAGGLTMAIDARMQFLLPDELTPFAADEIVIELDVKAPNRTVQVVGYLSDGSEIEIVDLKSPSIPWKGTLRDPNLLQSVRDGTLSVGLRVSDRSDVANALSATSVVEWQVDSFQASFRGRVLSTVTAPSGDTASSSP